MTDTPYYVEALLSGSSWSSGPSTPVTLSFGFISESDFPAYYGAPEYDTYRASFQPFNAAQESAARAALATWSTVANVTFVETAAASAQITFGTVDLGDGVGGVGFYPGAAEGGDIWISNRYPEYAAPVVGDYTFSIFVHEVGHALGLKHPGDYDAISGGGTPPFLPPAEDDAEHTVMSYHKDTTSDDEPRTPVLYDIAAIQHLYGANTQTNAGDTVYDIAADGFPFMAIWDGGGTDTLDLSGLSSGVTLHLESGQFDDLPGAYNFTVAYGTDIENAIGSSGGGTIYGNALDNILVAGGGKTTLAGGDGDDALYATGADGGISGPGSAGSDLLPPGEYPLTFPVLATAWTAAAATIR